MCWTENSKLHCIRVHWCHNHVESSIFHTSKSFDWTPCPVRIIGSTCTILWIGYTRGLWSSESQSFEIWARDLDTRLCICIVSETLYISPIIDCLESISFIPSPFERPQIPSSFVKRSKSIKSFGETFLSVRTVSSLWLDNI